MGNRQAGDGRPVTAADWAQSGDACLIVFHRDGGDGRRKIRRGENFAVEGFVAALHFRAVTIRTAVGDAQKGERAVSGLALKRQTRTNRRYKSFGKSLANGG